MVWHSAAVHDLRTARPHFNTVVSWSFAANPKRASNFQYPSAFMSSFTDRHLSWSQLTHPERLRLRSWTVRLCCRRYFYETIPQAAPTCWRWNDERPPDTRSWNQTSRLTVVMAAVTQLRDAERIKTSVFIEKGWQTGECLCDSRRCTCRRCL